jgi:hypothetical protein
MSTEDLQNSLDGLGTAIQDLANREAPAPVINDRSLSGNKINGGLITNFTSSGISDQASRMILMVDDDGITVDTIDTDTLQGDVSVTGALTVSGSITAQSLHVNELTADIRNERSTSLEFEGGTVAGKGLLWRTDEVSRQFVYHENPHRMFSSENIDLARTKHFSIGTVPVITETDLGSTIINSSLTNLGVLDNLSVTGNVDFDGYLFWEAESNRLGIGTQTPNATLSIASLDAEFIIDSENDSGIRIGNWTNDDLQIVTDDTTRLTVKANGNIIVGTQGNDNARLHVYGKLGVGVANIDADVSLSTAGPVKIDGRKMQNGAAIPTAGVYAVGDIVWNTNPTPTGYVGWVCVRDGTPGTWKAFGAISS